MPGRPVGHDIALEPVALRLLLVAQLDRLDALARHLDVAVEVELGADELRLVTGLGRGGFVEGGLEGARVDLEQRVARLHVLAFLKGHLDDLAVDAGLDDGRVERLNRADAAHVERNILLFGNRRGYRDGGRSADRRLGRPVAAGMLEEEVGGAGYTGERAKRAQPGNDLLFHSARTPSADRDLTARTLPVASLADFGRPGWYQKCQCHCQDIHIAGCGPIRRRPRGAGAGYAGGATAGRDRDRRRASCRVSAIGRPAGRPRWRCPTAGGAPSPRPGRWRVAGRRRSRRRSSS